MGLGEDAAKNCCFIAYLDGLASLHNRSSRWSGAGSGNLVEETYEDRAASRMRARGDVLERVGRGARVLGDGHRERAQLKSQLNEGCH